MRALKTRDLEDRKTKVLQAVIHQYIQTARPVGSKALNEMGVLRLSSATIRHILAELEQEGYITHPHTSAGRIPTDKGYRCYVESLADIQRLAIEEQERVEQEYVTRIEELRELMSTTSRILSNLSHHTGFVLSPKPEHNRLKHLELVQIHDRKVLLIMVTDSGLIRQHVVKLNQPIKPDRIKRVARVLNQRLIGHTLDEIYRGIVDLINKEEREYQEILSLARVLAENAFNLSEDELFLDGTSNLLSQLDLQDVEQVKSIFRLVDEKKMLSEILHKQLLVGSDRNVKVTIGGGEENYPELHELSMVSSVYNVRGSNVGVLGIIGPKRMEYSRMIALVQHVSDVLNQVFKRLE